MHIIECNQYLKMFIKESLNHLIGSQRNYCSSKAVRLSYNSIKSGECNDSLPPILIFHGLFGNKSNWKSMSKSLASRTHRAVHVFDLRNHGESGHSDDTRLIAMADDIKHFMDENQLKTSCVCGHSLGGRAVMQFAFLYPERVDKLIPVDITPNSLLPSSFFTANHFVDQLLESIKDLPPNLSVSEARKQASHKLETIIPDKFIRGFFMMNLDADENGKIKWKYNLPAIKEMIKSGNINNMIIDKPFTGSTLIIHGSDSQYVLKNDYNKILEVFPNAKFISIPESGHYLHIQKPNEVLNALVSFINS